MSVAPAPALEQVPGDGEDDLALAMRFVSVMRTMRGDSRWKVQQFLADAEAEMGGTLVIRSPRPKHDRSPAEAQYVPSGFTVSLAGGFPPDDPRVPNRRQP